MFFFAAAARELMSDENARDLSQACKVFEKMEKVEMSATSDRQYWRKLCSSLPASRKRHSKGLPCKARREG